MDFQLPFDIKPLPEPISYRDRMLLLGSCFTEHIGSALEDLRFPVMQNPNGILFGPRAVCRSLLSYIEPRLYQPQDLFRFQEVWHSWQHHSRFSHVNPEQALGKINGSQQAAHSFLEKANWLVITLGSSFHYRLTHLADTAGAEIGEGVANCHRAPANWFTREMEDTEEIKEMLEDCLKRLREFNPQLKFLFTISPVRHIREGVVENNRSKARLIEAVHFIVSKFEPAFYFPAYELVIDVLRDYRFYDVDMVHPNYPATQYVMERFAESCLDAATRELIPELRRIMIARKHRPFHPDTGQHRAFLAAHWEKARALQERFPELDLSAELSYFSAEG